MRKSHSARVPVVLTCERCGARNYKASRRPGVTRLEVRKFCKTCGVHVLHKESK